MLQLRERQDKLLTQIEAHADGEATRRSIVKNDQLANQDELRCCRADLLVILAEAQAVNPDARELATLQAAFAVIESLIVETDPRTSGTHPVIERKSAA
jgi:hypothetical protein